MNSFSVSHYICPDHVTVADFLYCARDHGAGAVGLTVRALEETGVRQLNRLLEETGLAVSSLNSAGYLTHADEEAAAEQNRRNKDLIAAAGDLGADVLCVIAGGKGPARGFLEDARRRVAEGLAELDVAARRAGVRLGLEPIHPAEVMWKGCINTVVDAVSITAEMANVDIVLDTFHSWWDPDMYRIFDETPGRVALIQVCNVRQRDRDGPWVRDFLSSGEIDPWTMVDYAINRGYTGRIEFELFSQHLDGRAFEAAIADASDVVRRWRID